MMTVHHIGLWVKDLFRSGQFYGHILGFQKQYAYQVPSELMKQIFGHPVDCQVEVWQRDEVKVELFQPAAPIVARNHNILATAINHFSLTVPDNTAFCQKAKEKGASVVEVKRNDHVIYFLRDPDGILIEMKGR